MVDSTPEKQVADKIDLHALAKELFIQFEKAEHRDLWISREEHAIQHAFIKTLMEEIRTKREAKERFRRQLQERVIGAATVSAILGSLGLIGRWVLTWIQTHLVFTITH